MSHGGSYSAASGTCETSEPGGEWFIPWHLACQINGKCKP